MSSTNLNLLDLVTKKFSQHYTTRHLTLHIKHQVFLAQGAMLCSMALLLLIVFGGEQFKSLHLVVLAYLLSGMAVGSFESNLV